MTREDSIECLCGGHYSKYYAEKHTQTKQHQRFLETGQKQEKISHSCKHLTEEEKLEKRREYFRNFYKRHPERWQACPSYNRGNGLPIKKQLAQSVC